VLLTVSGALNQKERRRDALVRSGAARDAAAHDLLDQDAVVLEPRKFTGVLFRDLLEAIGSRRPACARSH
jgi:hypothetical protein